MNFSGLAFELFSVHCRKESIVCFEIDCNGLFKTYCNVVRYANGLEKQVVNRPTKDVGTRIEYVLNVLVYVAAYPVDASPFLPLKRPFSLTSPLDHVPLVFALVLNRHFPRASLLMNVEKHRLHLLVITRPVGFC